MAKHTSKCAILLIISFLFIQSCQKQPNNIDVSSGYESIVRKLEDAIQYEIDSKDLNAISMVLVDDQEIVWAKGFGYEDPEKLIEADAYTVYRVGSVSKLFTDMAPKSRVTGNLFPNSTHLTRKQTFALLSGKLAPKR